MIDPFSHSNKPYCGHNHVFQNPLCKSQSLFKKIGIVAFHILTLGLPLVLYHAVSYCLKSSQNAVIPLLNNTPRLTSKSGVDALSFARNLVSSNKSKPWSWHGKVEEKPVDPEIDHMVAVYWRHAFGLFTTALQNNPNNSWESEEVIQAADTLMKMSYAISELTLKDLSRSAQAMKEKYSNQTFSYENMLNNEQHYAYYAVNYCSNVYMWIKEGVVWDSTQHCLTLPNSEKLKQMVFDDPKLEHTDHNDKVALQGEYQEFHVPGSIRNQWRELYNDYCDRMRVYMESDSKTDPQKALDILPKQDLNPNEYQPRSESLRNMLYTPKRLYYR